MFPSLNTAQLYIYKSWKKYSVGLMNSTLCVCIYYITLNTKDYTEAGIWLAVTG